MKWIRWTFRVFTSLSLAGVYAVLSCSIWVLFRNPLSRLNWYSRNANYLTPLMLKLMGVNVHLRDHTKGQGITPGTLVVANHLSYKDIFILSSLRPMLFISSVELSRTFFLGRMARFGGTVFVERRSPAQLHREIKSISDLLKQDFVVTLFPEAGTSDGEGLLPFKSALFQAAIEAGTRVQPVCIRYTQLDGRPVTQKQRRRVVWHRTLFIMHILKLFFHCRIQAEVDIFSPLPAKPNSRKELVRHSFELIRDCYRQALQKD
ncbi:lysophospholipid acyltransferase family protein [Desulfonatronospira sp.]|uniref:lysophospholipid acyltransferase family protein n=1 Tax=Desulfonatronospira sp. TaxID=1962951 RepID=UPI0025BA8FE7|nr:lysophospholipid acyltransferase family protein [Desulfonatronospira sp.]